MEQEDKSLTFKLVQKIEIIYPHIILGSFEEYSRVKCQTKRVVLSQKNLELPDYIKNDSRYPFPFLRLINLLNEENQRIMMNLVEGSIMDEDESKELCIDPPEFVHVRLIN